MPGSKHSARAGARILVDDCRPREKDPPGRSPMTTFRRAGLSTLLLLVAGCGGSGGGRGPLSGALLAARLRASVPATSTASWGPVASDGEDATFAFEHNVNGTLGAFDETYEVVASGGAFALHDPGSGELVYSGSYSASEDVFVAANLRAGELPEALAMTRKWDGDASAANLFGSFHAVAFRGSDAMGFSSTNRATFDGVSTGTLLAGGTTNSDGLIGAAGLAAPLSYAVASDGTTTVDAPGASFEGGLDVTGTLAVLAGSTTASEDPLAFFFVKDALSGSASTFSGTYGMVGMTFDVSDDDFRSFAGVLTADGAGAATYQGTANVEGTVAPTLIANATYSVAVDGTLTLVTPQGTFRGGIDETGTFAVVGGPVDPGSDPAFFLLVRR
jgi:hypothetical protein